MSKRRQKIASYRSERGAATYAGELSRAWRSVSFTVCSHPWDFAWTVRATFNDGTPDAYVLARPRGGVTVQHALIPHN
jgi:hypothetical protein